MSKLLVKENFSFRATYYRRGSEIDASTFSEEVTKVFKEQGKVVVAGGKDAVEIKSDPLVNDFLLATEKAAVISGSDEQHTKTKV